MEFNEEENLPDLPYLPEFNDLIHDLHTLVNQRNAYEILIYDFLVTPVIVIPESFWESVKVSFNGVRELGDIIGKDNCLICSESRLNFKNVNCCNQKLCNECCYKWFNESVKCPYCFQDIREFNLKNCTLKN